MSEEVICATCVNNHNMPHPNVLEKCRFPDEGGRVAINKLHGKIGLPKRKGEEGVLPKCVGKT